MTTKRPRGSTGKPRNQWVRQGWSIATGREREKVKKRKEKDQGRQEGGSSEGNVPCVLNQEFLFFVHKYWGSKATCLGWSIGSYKTSSTRKPCAKAVPETDSLTQQKQYHKRTTLHTTKTPLQSICSKEGCTIAWAKCKKAVIWQATNAIYGMGMLKIPLRSIRSEEGPHYRLWAKRKEAIRRQVTINPIHEFGYPLVIPYPGCTV